MSLKELKREVTTGKIYERDRIEFGPSFSSCNTITTKYVLQGGMVPASIYRDGRSRGDLQSL